MCFKLTSSICVGETCRGCLVQWRMAFRDQTPSIQYFPSSQLLTEDIHKRGQPPYLVVVRNDVIEYVLAKYPCAAAHYWKNVDQRQLVITLCKCKLVDVRLCLRNWEEKHQRSKFPCSLILSAKNTLSIN